MIKKLNNYIQEKLKINKNYSPKMNDDIEMILKSHMTDNPYVFEDLDFIILTSYIKIQDLEVLILYAKKLRESGDLSDHDDLKFLHEWISRATNIFLKSNSRKSRQTTEYWDEFFWILNGDKPYYGNAKFIHSLLRYDQIKYQKEKTPMMRRVNKMFSDLFDVNIGQKPLRKILFDQHKDEMNWY